MKKSKEFYEGFMESIVAHQHLYGDLDSEIKVAVIIEKDGVISANLYREIDDDVEVLENINLSGTWTDLGSDINRFFDKIDSYVGFVAKWY